ncbi:hypothetical protein FACS189474_5330 [Bacteroidia bacterium]|nr:hypothetical protein FACS189474_5330 [Bacteroidia bacterium]
MLTLLIWGAASMNAQVTIGSSENPAKAALLDIKNQAPNADNETVTTGGLVLPRVSLQSADNLLPFIPNDATFTSDVKRDHVGLIVYNVNPAFQVGAGPYLWNGSAWTVAGDFATGAPAPSYIRISAQPKKFSFYEEGTETAAALSVGVATNADPTDVEYKWYKVTGNNLHVRVGTPCVAADGSGFTTSSFTPSVLKGTTRNANNTGFYRYYCEATNKTTGEIVASDIAEVAVGCGAKDKDGEWISFLCFNLGAADLTIAAQKGHTMTINPANGSDGRHYYVANEEGVYGDLYQWGRIGDGHEKRGAGAGFTAGQNTAGANQIAYNAATPPTFENGNLIGTSQRYPASQVSRTDPNGYYAKFITTTATQDYNWAFTMATSTKDQLWRTGRYAANDPCAKIKDDATYETYYPATDGIAGANTNWRLPSPEEWGALYKGGTISGGPGAATANTWVWNGSNGRGYEVRPDGATTTLFLPASGYRNFGNGLLYYQGTGGHYWSNASTGTNAYHLHFDSGRVNPANSYNRGYGFALRCVKNT